MIDNDDDDDASHCIVIAVAGSSACVCPPSASCLSSDTVWLVDRPTKVQPRKLHSNAL